MVNWTRVIMNDATKKLINELPYASFDALEVSGHAWQHFGFKSYAATQFPAFDICEPSANDQQFDLIIAEQVFEHILWPYRAAQNVYQLLRRGGYLLITTPFLLPVHEVPHDCTRWTPTGLKYLLAEGGFDLDAITVDSWGNEACVKANLRRWTPYARWKHSLANSVKHPVVVWALARK